MAYFVRHYGWIVHVLGMSALSYLVYRGILWLGSKAKQDGALLPAEKQDKHPTYEWKPWHRWFTVTATALSWVAAGALVFVMPKWFFVVAVAVACVSGRKLYETKEDK